jgi:hypothetical protein
VVGKGGVGRGQAIQGVETSHRADLAAVLRAGDHIPSSRFNSREVELSMKGRIEPQPSFYKAMQKDPGGRPGNAPQATKGVTPFPFPEPGNELIYGSKCDGQRQGLLGRSAKTVCCPAEQWRNQGRGVIGCF